LATWSLSEQHVLLIDLSFKHQPEEQAFRAFQARVDPLWHHTAAELAEETNDWYAATFHWAWLVKASRQQGKADDGGFREATERLAAAYAEWLKQWKAEEAVTGPRPAPETLWPPALREVLANFQRATGE
jgi:hypothetical protein